MSQSATSRAVLLALKQQTTKALSSLQQEIVRRERELAMLKAEAARWMRALGTSGRRAGGAIGSLQGRKGKRPRLDWNAVLAELTPTFTAKDVAQKTGKPMEQVYAGVSRWVKDKKIKKTKDGYQRLVSGSTSNG